MSRVVTQKLINECIQKHPNFYENFKQRSTERKFYEYMLVREKNAMIEKEFAELKEQFSGLEESYRSSFDQLHKAISEKTEIEKELKNVLSEKSANEERLKKFLDEHEKKKAEEQAKAEARLMRQMYEPKSSSTVEPFLNKKDFELFMSRLKEKYYEVYILGVVLFSNALRYSDGIRLKFKEIKGLVGSLDLNDRVAIQTKDKKTGKPNTITFEDENIRKRLKEYFMRVEKTGIEIDDDTPLMINLRLKKPLKKSMINDYLMRILDELHDEHSLKFTKKIGTHSFRKTWTRLALLDKKINANDVREKLNHKTLEQTYRYAHFSTEEINGFLKLNVNI